VTRDDIRKLMGGYATGSLTEAERKLLFEAALDDQELFDELAREQALKEILDAPGAKQRLIAVLGKPQRVWWQRPLVWSAAATFAVAIAAVSWIVFRPVPPVEVAQVTVEKPAAPVAREPEVATSKPDNAPKSPNPAAAKRSAVGGPAEEKKAVPLADAPVELKEKDEKRADALDKVQASTPPPPPPAQRAQQLESRQQAAQSANQVQVQAAPFVDSGQRAQSAQGAIAPAAPSSRPFAAKTAPRFALDYTVAPAVNPQELILTFAADGYLSIHFSPGLDTIVESRVTAGSTRRERIPNNATEAAIVFSANPQTTSGGVSLTQDTRTGTVVDPAGVRIELLVRFY
jgi:hypothetical protein